MCITWYRMAPNFRRAKFFQAVILSQVYLSLQMHVPIFAFSAVLWHCSCVVLVAFCNVVLFSILGGTNCLDCIRFIGKGCVCVCVCVCGGGEGGSRGFAQSPPFAWKSKEKSITLHKLPFMSSPLVIEVST